jgi:hypothetical protein
MRCLREPRRACPRIAALAALAALAAAAPAGAGEIEELRALKAEIAAERAALAEERQALHDQRLRVEDTLQQIQDSARAQPAAGLSGSPLAGTASGLPAPTFDIYGFVMADAIYDFDRVDPDWKSTLRPSRIPVQCSAAVPGDPDFPGPDAGCGNDGETVISARQTRFGVKGAIPTPAGDLHAKFEFDLFGVGEDAGQTTFRLRHAWGELGQFGAGQTWSLFMDPDVFPNTIDYWGPVGMVFFRNVQVRWTPVNDDGLRAAVAIESPGAALDQGEIDTDELQALGGGISSWDQLPDVTAQLRLEQDWGHIQVAGIARRLGYEIRAQNGRGPDGYEIGAAGNLSGSFNLFEADKILWQVAGGRGFAGYMNDGGTDLAPDDEVDDAEAIPGIGWLLYYNRQWNEKFTSSIGFSEHRQFTTRGQADVAFDTGQYANVNLLYHPTPDMFVGPEFVWGRLENRGGDDGTDSRVQVSFQYNFGASMSGGR